MSANPEEQEVLDPIEGEEEDEEFQPNGDAGDEDDENDEEEDEEDGADAGVDGQGGHGDLFGNEDEDEDDSDFDMNQYRPVSDFDHFGVHRAAEEGDVARLKEAIARYGERPERRDVWGLTPLHTSVIFGSFDCFLELLTWPGTNLESSCQGSPLPHVILSAAAVSGNADFGVKALKTLMDRGASRLIASSKDEYERTPLRLACELGLELEFVEIILAALEQVDDVGLRRELLSCCDRIKKWNALHAAADITNPKRREEVMQVLLGRGGFSDVVNYFDAYSRTSLHVLVRRSGVFSEQDPCCKLLLAAGVNRQFKDVLGREASAYARPVVRQRRAPTTIFSHEICSKHYTAPPEDTAKAWYCKKDLPPENVNRLLVLLNERFGTLKGRRITTSGAKHDTNPPKVELGDVLRVHDWGYFLGFKAKCDKLDDDDDLGELDGDTTFSKKTYEAALYACGSAVEAVDRVIQGKIENAFCAVRPPGHHAGPSGICGGCTSHGFCFLNNVAIAAAYAMDRHRDKIQRVAIVDFDVHHGNGTEVIVENTVPNNVKEKFDLPLGGKMDLTLPSFKPWLGKNDFDNILFCSVHGYGKAMPGVNPDPRMPPFLPSFYPGSGKDRGWTDSAILNVGQNSSSRLEWRQAWRKIVLPRVLAFKPDLILVSAGFDAHAKDSINGGFCGALEQDYEWLTQQLVRVANEVCEGRLVSLLEGGYRIQGMCVSAFARSVAEHVRVLAESDPNIRFDAEEARYEMEELDRQILAAKEKAERENSLHGHLAAMLANSGADDAEDDEEEDEEDDNDGAEGMEVHAEDGEPAAELSNQVGGDASRVEDHKQHSLSSDNPDNRPRRRTARDIDFVKLNEELQKETKRMKPSE